MLEDELIEWQGSLKETYVKYLHPDNLDYEDEEMWELLGDNRIISLFQFDSVVGSTAANMTKPKNVVEMSQTNSLMRLMSDTGDQPIDTFVKFKEDISLWYQEMDYYGLNDKEVKIMEKHLLKFYGIATTQEDIMLISMDKNISNFTVAESNALRKGVAKKNKKVIDEIKELFYKKGLDAGTRKVFLDYVWNIQIARQLGLTVAVPLYSDV